MCMGGGGGGPAAPAQLPEAPRTPTPSAKGGTGDVDEKRRRAAAAGGPTSTILTGPRGIQDGAASSGPKTLLGA
jgi:hypothetical protein